MSPWLWRFAQVGGVLVYTFMTRHRAFCVVTFMKERKDGEVKESVLQCHICDLLLERGIVGLSRLGDEQVWMVQRDDGSYFHAKYFVKYLNYVLANLQT